MSLVDCIYNETTPLNSIQNYDSQKGSFNIQFRLSGGATEMIDLNSIRLLSNIRFTNNAGQPFNNFGILGMNIQAPTAPSGAGGAGGAAVGASTPAFVNASARFYDINSRASLNSCVQSIVYEDAMGNNLESIYSYPHLLNKVVPLTLSKDDCLTWAGHLYGIKSGARAVQNQTALNSQNEIAMKLYSGLSQSKPIPFSMIGGSLLITISLSMPSTALFGGQNVAIAAGSSPIGGGNNPNTANPSFFRMNRVRLVYKTVVLDENAPVLSQGYQFRHFTSLQTTILTGNNQNLYNPNTSNAISVLTSFIRSNRLNNYNNDSIQSNKLENANNDKVDIFQTNFLKNSTKMPLTFPIDERVYTQNNLGRNNYDTQRSYYYMSALTPLSLLNNTLLQSSTESYGNAESWQQPDHFPVSAGVGVRYANVDTSQGTNYMGGQSFQQQIESGLDGSAPNEGFTNFLGTKRIVATASGPVVMN